VDAADLPLLVRILGIGSYFKESNDALAHELLGEQLEDGAGTAAWPFVSPKRPQSRPLFVPYHHRVLEGLLNTNEQGANRPPSLRPARGPKNYLLERRMFHSLRTGKVIDKRWLRFSFRRFGTTTSCADSTICEMQESNPTAACVKPSKIVMARRHQKRALAAQPPSSRTYSVGEWRAASQRKPLEYHCALSESCVGTTTQRGSCDTACSALLGSQSVPRILHSESGSRANLP